MSAAQLEFDPLDDFFRSPETHGTSALKQQAAERLAAHRARRGHASSLDDAAPAPRPQTDTRAARIAAAVAERYAQSQSYRAFLAAEAERAIQQAEAAARQAEAVAEIAARTAQAVVATQQQLLSELENWNAEEAPAPMLVEPPLPKPEQPQTAQPPAAALTVRLYEDVSRIAETGVANAVPHESLDEDQRLALDDEIAFRHSPNLEEFLEPAIPIPANLIEFPRQLVAPRKARPRLAEGPLREEAELAQEGTQLRIFEVEPDQISVEPSTDSTLPEWSSIRLSACTTTEPLEVPENVASYGIQFVTAPLGLRLMSAIVDGCLVLASFLGFTTVVAYTAGRVPTGQIAAIGAAGTLAALFLLYQILFFTFSDATPGMRYARIGLCTFSDENPTRSAMRRRIVAILLAACPIGLGLLWAWLDDDHLGWHDRISRMYQRSY
ncbi:RDD family protein [Granulicella arctica]|nr:RDD family protein [Granulicella arctica]